MLYLTMNQIKAHSPCIFGWDNLRKKAKESGISYPKDGDIQISMRTLLDWCPVEDVIWIFRCNWEEGKELYIKFAKGCAKRAKAAANAYADAAAYAAYAANAAASASATASATANAAAAAASATAAAYAAYAATAADASATASAADAYARERRLQKASLRALLRNHKG